MIFGSFDINLGGIDIILVIFYIIFCSFDIFLESLVILFGCLDIGLGNFDIILHFFRI